MGMRLQVRRRTGSRSAWFTASRSAFAVREAPLDAAASQRHQQAADEEHRRREGVALARHPKPGLVLARLADNAEEVEQPDDGDERRVLEQVDDRVDEA